MLSSIPSLRFREVKITEVAPLGSAVVVALSLSLSCLFTGVVLLGVAESFTTALVGYFYNRKIN